MTDEALQANHRTTPEQRARDLFGRMNIDDAQSFAASEVVELANLIAEGRLTNAGALLFMDERMLSAASNEDLDLATLLTGAFNETFAKIELKAILFIANTANTTRLTVSCSTSNVVPMSMDAGGFATVAVGIADLLNVANEPGASATYRIIIIGAVHGTQKAE